jgi:ATP-binding cassette subfamily C (CFTR/MRP) protein 1
VQDMHHLHLSYFVTFAVGLGLAILEFGLEYLVPKKLSAYDALGDEYECPYEYTDVFSVLTFGWMTPLMKTGYNHFLTQDDLWNLRKRDTSEATSEAFEKAWAHELTKKKPNLWFTLARAYGGPYLRGAIVKVPSDILQFVQPYFLHLLMNFVASYRTKSEEPLSRGVAISLTMFAISIGGTICLHQYFQRAFETGMRVKSGLTGAIYAKAMKLSNEGKASKSTGDVVNYMAVDAQRLQDLMQFLQQTWSAPFQITLCMTFLYQFVGPSMFAGVGIMIIMIPINGVISRVFKKLQTKQMKNKDMRTRLTAEILNNMKSIKLYAWNTAFLNKLNHVRNDLELNTLRKIGAAQALANLTFSTTPFFVSCATFSIFALTQDKPLTVDIVFPSLALFNLLNFPLMVLPNVITNIIEAFVAVERLTSYLLADELQPDAVRIEDSVAEVGEESVRIKDGTFKWNKNDTQNTLEDINFSANKGELSCVVGRVGAGKSSFLQALLGDLYKTQGEVVIRGRTAYVAQTPWITNGSVKENITFGFRFDPHFYEQTIKACALIDDFATLPSGDDTLVGERGISLSGGQKARVSLARAVYARADIYIMDDVLSAVDQHVGRHIIDNVLGQKGLLAGKTRILATNSIPVLREADFLILIKDQKIAEKGTYEQLVAMKGEVANIVKTSSTEESPPPSPMSTSTASIETVFMEDGEIDPDAGEPVPGEGTTEDTLAALRPIQRKISHPRRTSTSTLRRASTASNRIHRAKATDEEQGGTGAVQNKEKSEQGKVKWSVYAAYASSANSTAVVIWLIVLVAAQSAQIGMLQTDTCGSSRCGPVLTNFVQEEACG